MKCQIAVIKCERKGKKTVNAIKSNVRARTQEMQAE